MTPPSPPREPAGAEPRALEQRGAFIRFALATVLGANLIFAIARLGMELAGRGLTPWWVNAAGVAVSGAVWAWYRGAPTRRATATVQLLGLTALACLLVPVAYGMASSLWWVSLVGFAMVLMGTRGEALAWAIVTIAVVVAATLAGPNVRVAGAAGETELEGLLSRAFFVVVLLGLAYAFQRVTRSRALELAAARRDAERSAAAKSAFLAHMSHELRTPLNGVIGMLDLAERRVEDPRVRQQLATASQSANLLLRLIQDILDTTRLEDGALELRTGPFPLHRTLANALVGFEEPARQRGLAYTATAAPGLAQWREGDALRLAQIALNLVSNALKFTDTGQVVVELDRGSSDDELRLTVSDTGAGIAPKDLDAIFEPFVQVGTRETRHAGAGLGLSIAAELARRMGGRLEVASTLGEGSTFTLTVPLPRVPDRPGAGPESLLAPAPASASAAPAALERGLRVLAVDDDPTNRFVMQHHLQALGCEVTSAASGAEALVRVSEGAFDVALVDLEMPGMSGFELASRLREGGHDRLPLVAVTAHADAETRRRAMDAGMTRYLAKPFAHDALARTIREALRA